MCLLFIGPSFYGEVFYFSHDLRESIWKDNVCILYFSNYKTFGSLDPSSREMRYNPFLGSMNPKSQKMRKQRGGSVGSGKYEWEWYNDLSRGPPVETIFSRMTYLLGNHVNHQGEIRENV